MISETVRARALTPGDVILIRRPGAIDRTPETVTAIGHTPGGYSLTFAWGTHEVSAHMPIARVTHADSTITPGHFALMPRTLAYVDGFGGLIPVIILATHDRETVTVQVTANRAGYSRGEVFTADIGNSRIVPRTAVFTRNGHYVITNAPVIAYPYPGADYTPVIGERCAIHPATDWFMRGFRYGTVRGYTRTGSVRVRLDRLTITRDATLSPSNILPVS